MKNNLETSKTSRDTASENVIPRYVKSQINEQVKLPLAEVHALRLGLMNNTNFSLVKCVSTLVPKRIRYFAEILILGY